MRALVSMFLLLFAWFVLTTVSAAAADQNDGVIFEDLFKKWTDAFNRKDIVGSAGLFSRKVVADYQGVPRKNYTTIYYGFKKIFGETKQQYKYRFKLRDLYRSGDLAAVRITWYLDISEEGKPTTTVEDQGLDVLQRNKDGTWQIINCIAYPEKSEFDEPKK